MGAEKRSGNKDTQDDLKKRLNAKQALKLESMEATGWELFFIRSRLLLPPIVVLRHVNDGDIVVLEGDGSVNEDHGLIIRQDEYEFNK
jgi:hypothetical protein